jgi:hypothetical protein
VQSTDHEEDETVLSLAEQIRADNESMQADIRQLQELLRDAQDQVSHLQTQQFEKDSYSQSIPLADELPVSPNPNGPALSPNLDDSAPRDWSSTYQNANVMGRLPHTSNDSVTSNSTSGSRLNGRRRSHQRTVPSSSLRRTGGRAMSVDLTGMMQRKLEVSSLSWLF